MKQWLSTSQNQRKWIKNIQNELRKLIGTYFFTFVPDPRELVLNKGILNICGGTFGCLNDYGLHVPWPSLPHKYTDTVMDSPIKQRFSQFPHNFQVIEVKHLFIITWACVFCFTCKQKIFLEWFYNILNFTGMQLL